LLIVRVTTSRGWPGSSDSADGVPVAELGVRLVDDDHAGGGAEDGARPRRGRAPSRSGCSASRAHDVGPVLLDRRHRRLGARRVKSAARGPVTQAVNVSRQYSGYIEYVGAKPSAVRPGPPNA
jgi:hypothetical protein